MLNHYDKSHHIEEVRKWYDGYLFGENEVYNPWSLINYIDKVNENDKSLPSPFWSNTSSNKIVRDLIEKADKETKLEIESLILGETIEKPIHEDITYDDMYLNSDNLWNFLYFTGYLKKVSERMEGVNIHLKLEIPNYEIRYIYMNAK